MFKVSRMGLMYVFFVLLALTPCAPIVVPDAHVQLSVTAQLSPEEKALTDHLSEKYSKPYPLIARIVKAAYLEGQRLSISPLTLLAVMEKESSFKASVVNFYGAVGLMQVVPRVHLPQLSKDDAVAVLTQPEANIRMGASILSEYVAAKNGNLDKALRKYSGNASGYAKKVRFYQDKLVEIARTARA